MKQLWGEGNYHTEFDDLMKGKATTKGYNKIMNVLEVLRERSVHQQLCAMLLLLLSLQLCGLSAVEYALFPCLDLLWSLQSATMPTCPFPWVCMIPPHTEPTAWHLWYHPQFCSYLSGSFSGGNTRAPTHPKFLLPSFPWWYNQGICTGKGYKYPKAYRSPAPLSLISAVADGQLLPSSFISFEKGHLWLSNILSAVSM